MNKSKKKIIFVTYSAAIAALYVVLTMLSAMMVLSSGVIQLRFSEALTILPYFTPAAIPGLFIGCLISNLITGATLIDVVFGSIATLLGALGTYLLRKSPPILSPIPPIVANTVIIPHVLKYAYCVEDALWFIYLTVFAGEVISCGVFGLVLLFALRKNSKRLFLQ